MGQDTETAHDRRWSRDLIDSVRCAGVLLCLLLLVDRAADTLSPWRCVLWCTLAGLLFLVLYPSRVSVGEGWLASRRLLRTRRVRTDLLLSVRCRDGVSPRLVFRDIYGDRVEIGPQVLLDNPDIWHRLTEDTHKSLANGTLTCGATALRQMTERIDQETAATVFKVSGLS